MKVIYKYLIFFIIGIILSLFTFKKRIVEGIELGELLRGDPSNMINPPDGYRRNVFENDTTVEFSGVPDYPGNFLKMERTLCGGQPTDRVNSLGECHSNCLSDRGCVGYQYVNDGSRPKPGLCRYFDLVASERFPDMLISEEKECDDIIHSNHVKIAIKNNYIPSVFKFRENEVICPFRKFKDSDREDSDIVDETDWLTNRCRNGNYNGIYKECPQYTRPNQDRTECCFPYQYSSFTNVSWANPERVGTDRCKDIPENSTGICFKSWNNFERGAPTSLCSETDYHGVSNPRTGIVRYTSNTERQTGIINGYSGDSCLGNRQQPGDLVSGTFLTDGEKVLIIDENYCGYKVKWTGEPRNGRQDIWIKKSNIDPLTIRNVPGAIDFYCDPGYVFQDGNCINITDPSVSEYQCQDNQVNDRPSDTITADNNPHYHHVANKTRPCRTCENGTQPNSHRTGCEPCPSGTAGTNGVCSPCSGFSSNDRTNCVVCTGNEYFSASDDSCHQCPNGSVPNSYHNGCVYCDSLESNVDSPHSTCTDEFADTGFCGPNWIVDPNDNTKCSNKCTIPSNTLSYVVEDNDGLKYGDNFNPTVTCDTNYLGNPISRMCNYPGEDIILSGCLPENVFNNNLKCGDFKDDDILDLTNRCNKIYSNVLENKKCYGEQCNSTSYCCESNVPDQVKNLTNKIYFSDQYELTNKTQAEFDTWYHTINSNMQTLQRSLQNNEVLDYSLLTLKDGIMDLFNSDTSKYNNRDNFKENWIGGGGGQEEISDEVWERLINTINTNRETKLTSNDNLGNLTPEEIKLLLIKLDMPIRDSEGAIKYQAGHNSAGEILGLSPLDIFLHNNRRDDRGISNEQLEALL